MRGLRTWVAYRAALPATTIDETIAASNGMELSDAELDPIPDALDYYARIERQKGRDFYRRGLVPGLVLKTQRGIGEVAAISSGGRKR
jgi:hypothetical protein